MEQPNLMTWFAHRRVGLAIGEAAFALDALAAQSTLGSAGARDRLLARPIPCRWPRTRVAPVRRYAGPVSVGGGFLPVRVELELAPWSTSVSELGARPLTRRPPEWRATRYWRIVHALLDDLALKLESIAVVSREVGHDAMPRLIAALAA